MDRNRITWLIGFFDWIESKKPSSPRMRFFSPSLRFGVTDKRANPSFSTVHFIDGKDKERMNEQANDLMHSEIPI
jgi:hypothetical protein